MKSVFICYLLLLFGPLFIAHADRRLIFLQRKLRPLNMLNDSNNNYYEGNLTYS